MESDNVDVSSEKGTERQGISMKIRRLSVDTATLAYAIFGSGKIDMVIEMGLGAVMGEWWNLARRLSAHHTILLYERAGYGSSSMSTLERTPENIPREGCMPSNLHVCIPPLSESWFCLIHFHRRITVSVVN